MNQGISKVMAGQKGIMKVVRKNNKVLAGITHGQRIT